MDDIKTILIIEDEPDHLKAIQQSLTDAVDDLNVVTASNGLEGLKIAQNTKPDVIMMDVIMPNMDGIETLEALRDLSEHKKTPVIMLTNIETNQRLKSAEQFDVFEYLVKAETSMEKIVETVKKALKL